MEVQGRSQDSPEVAPKWVKLNLFPEGGPEGKIQKSCPYLFKSGEMSNC